MRVVVSDISGCKMLRKLVFLACFVVSCQLGMLRMLGSGRDMGGYGDIPETRGLLSGIMGETYNKYSISTILYHNELPNID